MRRQVDLLEEEKWAIWRTKSIYFIHSAGTQEIWDGETPWGNPEVWESKKWSIRTMEMEYLSRKQWMWWNYLVLIDEHVFPLRKDLNPGEYAQAFGWVWVDFIP